MSGVTVVIGTFDKYSAAWPAMCHGLKKYWPDCPWPIIFVTDETKAPKFETITVGRRRAWWEPWYWSKRVQKGLDRIKTPIVLWLTEDNWLTAPPDTRAIMDFAGYIREGRADHIRLYPGWDHDIPSGRCDYDSRLLPLSEKSPYRCSLKPALWRKETFKLLIWPGETAWEFEQRASKRSHGYGSRFLAVAEWGHYFPMVTRGDPTGPWVKSPIVKGRWTKAAERYALREGLNIDFCHHPIGRIIDDKLRKVNWVLP